MTSLQNSSDPGKMLGQQVDINATLKAAGIGVWALDPLTKLVSWDERCREFFGLFQHNLLTYEQAVCYIHPEDANRVNEAVEWAMSYESGGEYDVTFRTVGADDGKLRWVRFWGQAYFNEARQVYSFSGLSQNVTEQELARQKVEERENHLRSLIEQAPVATGLFVGPDFIVELANDLILRFWGKGKDVLGKPLAEVLPELVEQPFLKILSDVYASGQPYKAIADRCELIVDGQIRTFYFNFTYQPIVNEKGEVYAIMDMAVDVTAQVMAQQLLAESRQRMEESEARYRGLSAQLEHQVKLRTEELATTNEELTTMNEELIDLNDRLIRSNENLEKFAYVASHDLQEPLRKIQSFGDILKTQYTTKFGDEGGIDYLTRMQVAANRMSTLLRDLLSFSRISTQRNTTKDVPLNTIMTMVLTDLELIIAESKAQINVQSLPTVTGDPTQLGQLFQNLLSNALKFRRPNTTPVIDVRVQTLGAGKLPASIQPARSSKFYHRIDVTDNGIGFDEVYLDRIFQVFQRLHGKNQFAGTGIGLAICEKVVTNHGGAITATSKPGEGATFTVYLPL